MSCERLGTVPPNGGMDKTLQQQFQQVQSAAPASVHAELAGLISVMLRSRKIARPPHGQSLSGIYQDLYDRLWQQLEADLTPLPTRGPADLRQWASETVQQASCTILTDDSLKALALEAQRHPASSPLRRHALVQLVEAIRLAGRLAKPHRAKFAPQFYDLLYDDAVNQTLAYVCRRIDTYDPTRGQAQKFMNWVNFRLDRMVIECRRATSDFDTESLPNLNDLDALPQPESADSLTDTVRDYIQSDPEGLFQQTHVRNRPDATFQAIALARFSNESWEDISARLDVKIPTLSSFFQRCCQKFSAQFQTLL